MVVELTTLRLPRGTDEAEFLEADARAQAEFYYLQPGIVRRTTARSRDDWLIVTLWEDDASASAAADAACSDPVAAAFASLVEVTDVRRYQTLD